MASVQNVAARILLYLRGGKELYDIRRGSLMNIYVEIVDTLKHIEEWVNWCVSEGTPLKIKTFKDDSGIFDSEWGRP